MQVEFTKKILNALSNERLSRYPQGDSLKLVSNYVWNMALNESLYPTLQTLEVVLRNAIHNNAKAYFGNDYWFDAANLFNDPNNHSHENAKSDLKSARKSLTKERKPHDAPRIVAALPFGFWSNLFNDCYEDFWRKLIKDTFPYMPNRNRKRNHISTRINKFRRLRNRIFHHEPIWHWRDLRQQHDDMLETIRWIEPVMCDLLLVIDEFPSIYDNGLVSIEQRLKQLSVTKCLDMIRETAYFLAEQHDFKGNLLQYRLDAERQVTEQHFW